MNASANDTKSHITAIDGLRALAVLGVVVFHLNPNWLQGGFVGVDLFFVISGYVVTRSITGKNWISAREFFTAFLARRISRIYPALIACLLITAIAQTLLVPKAWLNDTAYKAGMAAFFGLSNFALVYFDDGYFSPRSEFNPFTHTWSLGVEEQFYVIFALAWWFTRKNRPAFFLTMGISAGAALIYSAITTSAAPAHAYYLLPSRWWELALGASLAQWHHGRKSTLTTPIFANLAVLAGLLLIGYSATTADEKAFPYPDAISVVAGAILCIHGLVRRGQDAGTFGLENPLLVHIGQLSYSLYLWHWPVIVLFKWTIGLETLSDYVFCTLATLTLSYVSYYFVEKPLRYGLIRSLPQPRIVLAGMGAMIFGSALTALLYVEQSKLSLSVTSNTALWYAHSDPAQTQWKQRSEKPVIYAFGDSHAGMLGIALNDLEQQFGVESKIVTQSGCAAASLRSPPSERCRKFIDSTIPELAKQARQGDVVILASLRSQRISDQWGLIENSQSNNQLDPDTQNKAFEEADALITKLSNAGYKVVLSAPLPVFGAPPFRCSDIFNRSNPVCKPGLEIPRNQALKWREPAMKQIQALKMKHPNLVIWDPFFDVCPTDTCKAVDGEPLFFDGDHLTAAGNRRILPSLSKAVAGERPEQTAALPPTNT